MPKTINQQFFNHERVYCSFYKLAKKLFANLFYYTTNDHFSHLFHAKTSKNDQLGHLKLTVFAEIRTGIANFHTYDFFLLLNAFIVATHVVCECSF